MIVPTIIALLALYLLWRAVSYAIVHASLSLAAHERRFKRQAELWLAGKAHAGHAYQFGYGERAERWVRRIHRSARYLARSDHSLHKRWRAAVRS